MHQILRHRAMWYYGMEISAMMYLFIHSFIYFEIQLGPLDVDRYEIFKNK